MAELGVSLERMSFAQLLLLLGFVASYALAVGGMLGARGRWRAAALALLTAAGLVLTTRPWVHGALLVGFVVAGLALFVVASWLLAWLVAPRVSAARSAAAPSSAPADSSAPPQTSLPPDSVPAAVVAGKRRWPRLARRTAR